MSGYFTRTYELWRKTGVPDGGGGTVYTWAKIADVSGRAYPTRQEGDVIAQQRAGVVTWTFASNPDAGVTEGDEIRFDGRKLTVLSVSVTSTGRRLESLCEEVR